MKIRKEFYTEASDYTHRNGEEFVILRRVTRNTLAKDRKEYDLEALPMYEIQFSDGHIASAFPEEVEE